MRERGIYIGIKDIFTLRKYRRELSGEDTDKVKRNFWGLGGGSRIAVTATGRFAGTSLFSVMLAGFISKNGFKVCFTEYGVPETKTTLIYDSYAMEQRFSRTGFVDFYEAAARGERLSGLNNLEKITAEQKNKVNVFAASEETGFEKENSYIDWRVICPKDIDRNIRLDDGQFSRLESSARGEFNISDVEADPYFDFILSDADLIFVLVCPMPSRLIREAERIKAFKRMEKGARVIWVINRMNSGVSKREIYKILRSNDILFIDEISTEILCGCEYKCSYPWTSDECRNAFWSVFTKDSH